MTLHWKNITIAFCIAVTVAAIAYDVLANAEGGVSATISRVLRAAAMDYPIIPFAVGVLIGHLFWSQGK
jgi:hypothetical protein